MTTLVEHVTWASYETELKSFLGVTGVGEDINLEMWLDAAAEMGDAFIDVDFVDDDGNDADPPVNTVIGCFAYVKGIRDATNRNLMHTEVKTASLMEKYINPAGATSASSVHAIALRAARPYWDPYKADPTLAGAL